MTREEFNQLQSYVSSEDYVRYYAHSFWRQDGCPDGEEVIKTLFGNIKIKELHWMKATAIQDFDIGILRDLYAIYHNSWTDGEII